MEVSTLRMLTEDLAAYLSEVTIGELTRAVPGSHGDVGDLFLTLIDQNVSVATAITGLTVARNQWPNERAALGASIDIYGGIGLESAYRQTALLMQHAFAATTDEVLPGQADGFPEPAIATLYEVQISSTVIHTWDLSQALGFTYVPARDVIRRALRSAVAQIARNKPNGTRADTVLTSENPNDSEMFDAMLILTGRR